MKEKNYSAANVGVLSPRSSPVRTARKPGWTQRKADFMLGIVASAWGIAYLLMKIGLESIPPYSMIALRFVIAFAVVAVIFFRKLLQTTKRTLLYGASLGLLLFGVFAFLMRGLETTSASNGAFLISTSVVLVPIVHAILSRRLPERPIIIGTVLTMVGIGFLVLQQSFALHSGDILCLFGAITYTFQILLTDRLTRKEDSLLLGIWQLGFTGLYGVIFTVLFETPTLPSTPAEWGAILGLALICSSFGFVVQPVAQRYTTPEHTGLLFALEPVSSALLAFIFLHEVLSIKSYLGAVLVLVGVLIASAMPSGKKKREPDANKQEIG